MSSLCCSCNASSMPPSVDNRLLPRRKRLFDTEFPPLSIAAVALSLTPFFSSSLLPQRRFRDKFKVNGEGRTWAGGRVPYLYTVLFRFP